MASCFRRWILQTKMKKRDCAKQMRSIDSKKQVTAPKRCNIRKCWLQTLRDRMQSISCLRARIKVNLQERWTASSMGGPSITTLIASIIFQLPRSKQFFICLQKPNWTTLIQKPQTPKERKKAMAANASSKTLLPQLKTILEHTGQMHPR